MVSMQRWIQTYHNFRPFTDEEAWLLFRLAAFGEAVGWTVLISGILCKNYILHGNNAPVLIAGQIHGTLFLIYIAAAGVLSPSLRWTVPQTIGAGLASVPPYGSLLFEMTASHFRHQRQIAVQQTLAYYRFLVISA